MDTFLIYRPLYVLCTTIAMNCASDILTPSRIMPKFLDELASHAASTGVTLNLWIFRIFFNCNYINWHSNYLHAVSCWLQHMTYGISSLSSWPRYIDLHTIFRVLLGTRQFLAVLKCEHSNFCIFCGEVCQIVVAWQSADEEDKVLIFLTIRFLSLLGAESPFVLAWNSLLFWLGRLRLAM